MAESGEADDLAEPNPAAVATELAPGLAQALMTHTATLHREAERTGFVNDMLRRQASHAGYCLFLRNLVPAYRAMEAGLARLGGQPAFAGVDWPALYRSPALAADLASVAGPAWATSLPLLPVATRYGEAVAEAAAGDGAGLLGHAYARYLGDLSGGQILQRILLRQPGLPAAALAFYEFPAISEPDAFKDRYRAALDAAAAWVDQGTVLAAAAHAFELNIALSVAVQDQIAAAG